MKAQKTEELLENIKALQAENRQLSRSVKYLEQERIDFLQQSEREFYLAHEIAGIEPEEGHNTLEVLRKIQEQVIRQKNALAHADGIVLELNISVFVDKNGHIKVAVRSPQGTQTAKTPE